MSSLDIETFDALSRVTTATITTVLLKKGLRNVWIRGAFPTAPGTKCVVGRAFTVRFVPAREDFATPESWSSPKSTRGAIEQMPAGCIAVVDAMGVKDAGIWGDILCARMVRRGVAALVTDGVVRDLAGVLSTNLPVWASGAAAPPSVARLTFVDSQQPVACGGVAVFPDDLIIANQDGAVLIPAGFVDDVVAAAVEQENLEAWIMDEVGAGASLSGLYPPNRIHSSDRTQSPARVTNATGFTLGRGYALPRTHCRSSLRIFLQILHERISTAGPTCLHWYANRLSGRWSGDLRRCFPRNN